MDTLHVLFSGDFWHEDFRKLLSQVNVPATFVPLEAVETFEGYDSDFDLIVLAQCRRDRIQNTHVEMIRRRFPGTPIVNLLGSWCEGETRSGEPLDGVTRVYWHQWAGRFQQFVQQMIQNGITGWHLPETATAVDWVDEICRIERPHRGHSQSGIIGVSAWSADDFDMLKDALQTIGWQSKWIERNRWDSSSASLLRAICVDGRSKTTDLERRLSWLQSNFNGVPVVLVMSFPRIEEVRSAGKYDVGAVVSKPFNLDDLRAAIDGLLNTGNDTPTLSAHFSSAHKQQNKARGA
ncbi:MAG: hypothetical protein AAF456_21250 [Planctomycetota bacterium]